MDAPANAEVDDIIAEANKAFFEGDFGYAEDIDGEVIVIEDENDKRIYINFKSLKTERKKTMITKSKAQHIAAAAFRCEYGVFTQSSYIRIHELNDDGTEITFSQNGIKYLFRSEIRYKPNDLNPNTKDKYIFVGNGTLTKLTGEPTKTGDIFVLEWGIPG